VVRGKGQPGIWPSAADVPAVTLARATAAGRDAARHPRPPLRQGRDHRRGVPEGTRPPGWGRFSLL